MSKESEEDDSEEFDLPEDAPEGYQMEWTEASSAKQDEEGEETND